MARLIGSVEGGGVADPGWSRGRVTSTSEKKNPVLSHYTFCMELSEV